MPDKWLSTIADVVKFYGWGDDRGWAMTWSDTLFWLGEAVRMQKSQKKE